MNKNEIRAESRETKRFFRRFSRPARVSEYRRLWAKADKLLDREIKKPSAKKDETLIAECVETMVYCDRQLAELHAEAAHRAERKQSSRYTLWPKNAFARAAVAAAAVVLILGLGTAVTKAAGLDVWSALVHWDSDYLKIDYSLREAQNDPPKGEYHEIPTALPGFEDIIEELHFVSEAELKAYFGSSLLYPYGLEGLEFVSASALKDGETVNDLEIDVVFRGSLLHIDASINHENTPNESFAFQFIDSGSYDTVENVFINDTECIVACSETSCLLSFAVTKNVYQIKGAVPAELIKDFAAEMLH